MDTSRQSGQLVSSCPTQSIIIQGAKEHNLKNISLALPKGKLIVFTGPSGSGKTSLAFDTLYAEGQRRYVESLSTFARQFLGQLPRPDVDQVTGLSPSISIAQKSAGTNPRSTVATMTEIHDFLRVLYARVGTAHCPTCDAALSMILMLTWCGTTRPRSSRVWPSTHFRTRSANVFTAKRNT